MWGEVGAFEDEIAGGGSEAGGEAAHDASEGEGLGVIGDDEVMGLEFRGFAIEGDEYFVGKCWANANGAVEFVGIEGVEWLTGFEHDEVRDVDDIVDGAEANGFEFTAEPVGAWADGDLIDFEGGIEAARFAEDVNDIGGKAFVELVALREAECFGGKNGDFASDADVAEQIGTVGGDFEIEDGVSWEEFG